MTLYIFIVGLLVSLAVSYAMFAYTIGEFRENMDGPTPPAMPKAANLVNDKPNN